MGYYSAAHGAYTAIFSRARIIFKRRKTGYVGGTEASMRTLFYFSESRLERIKPFFPRSHGAPACMAGASSAASSTSSSTVSVEGCI